MNQQQTEEVAQNFKELGQNFSQALIASYRMSGRRDPELTTRFCADVINYLEAQAADAFAAFDEQLAQVDGDQEPSEPPEQESVGIYMGFLGDLLAYYMGSDSSTTANSQGGDEAPRGD
jgi:hypothetical protein